MLSLEVIVAGAIFVSLTFYALLGGADFGGGVWDLLASGPRAGKQRELISNAIAPIWEANHVWLILSLVLTFVSFPDAFYTIMVALHIPLTLTLIGIVLRGAAFTFRHYDTRGDDVQQRWGRLFAVASTLTPLMLGVCVGAVASGRMIANGQVTADYFQWLAPFPLAVGGLTLALFAFIAAVYLAAETADPQLRDDFRKRALLAAACVGVMALTSFLLTADGAPRIRAGLTRSVWSWPLHILTGMMASGAICALLLNRIFIARVLAVGQMVLILAGWALAQFPYLVEPDITIYNSAAPDATLKTVVGALGLGIVIVFPSFYILYRVFKGERAFKITAKPDQPKIP